METFSIGRKIRRRGFLTPRVFFGLLLILVGLAFTLQRSGFIDDPRDILQYWPVLLIVAGLAKFFWPESPSGRWWGILFLGAGAWLLLEAFGVVLVGIGELWPLALVLLGARLLWRGREVRPVVVEGREGLSTAATVQAIAALGGATRRCNSADFRGGDLVAFMGGCEVDLRQAHIQGEAAVIEAFAFWGGIEIRVPEDWTVTVEGIALLGAYEDSTHTRESGVMPRQELIVKGLAIMGGVEIKN